MSDMNKKGKVEQNQNGFTWKKKKQIACITVQHKRVITMDLKVNVAAGNL